MVATIIRCSLSSSLERSNFPSLMTLNLMLMGRSWNMDRSYSGLYETATSSTPPFSNNTDSSFGYGYEIIGKFIRI